MSELSRRRFLYLSGGAAATATGVGVWAALLRGESEKGILVPPSTTLGTASTTTTTTTTTTAPTPPQNPVVVIVQMNTADTCLTKKKVCFQLLVLKPVHQ